MPLLLLVAVLILSVTGAFFFQPIKFPAWGSEVSITQSRGV